MNKPVSLIAGLFVIAFAETVGADSCSCQDATGQSGGLIFHASFDGNRAELKPNVDRENAGVTQFVPGLVEQAIRIRNDDDRSLLKYAVQSLKLGHENDFSLQFWVRTTMDSVQKAVLLSTKDFPDNSLVSQKKRGWVFAVFDGTWAWNAGSGNRRISYDRTNGQFMPVNDGRWHQLAMTHSACEGLVRLYFDGKNMVTYNVRDSAGFPFENNAE